MHDSNREQLVAAAQLLRPLLGDRCRMLHLAERSEAGTLTPEEQTEFDGYLHVGNLLAVIQSKARVALKTKRRERP